MMYVQICIWLMSLLSAVPSIVVRSSVTALPSSPSLRRTVITTSLALSLTKYMICSNPITTSTKQKFTSKGMSGKAARHNLPPQLVLVDSKLVHTIIICNFDDSFAWVNQSRRLTLCSQGHLKLFHVLQQTIISDAYALACSRLPSLKSVGVRSICIVS